MIDFDWGRAAPDARLAETGFRAEWTGYLVVQESGRHAFWLAATDPAASLSISTTEGRPLAGLDEPGSIEVDLDRGVHDLRVGFRRPAGDARIRLEWRPPGGERETLDARHLLHPSRNR